jgi:hypothetical protein
MPMGMPYPKGKMSMSKMMGVESAKDKMPMKAEKADMFGSDDIIRYG